jgi:hypothetical protein
MFYLSVKSVKKVLIYNEFGNVFKETFQFVSIMKVYYIKMYQINFFSLNVSFPISNGTSFQ